MTLIQKYGPLLDQFPEYKEYVEISETVFVKTSKIVGNDVKDFGSVEGRLFSILMYHALNTSYSIRLLNSYTQCLEALALLRVRLEQVVVSSYLIHAPHEKGLHPYLQDIGKDDYRVIKNLKEKDPALLELIDKLFSDKYDFSNQIKDPFFDFNTDKIKRKWTSLSVHDLARDRDKYASQDHPIFSIKLQRYYFTLYKLSSIFIHSDTGCVTNNLVMVGNTNQGPQLSPNIWLVFSNLMQNAHLDIIQCYEVLHYFNKPGKDDLLEVYERLKIKMKNDFGT